MKKMKQPIFITTLLFSVFGLAQDTLSISKNDISKKISENNLQVRIAEKNFQSAKADYNQSKSVFLPNVNVSHTGISTTNPLMAFGSKLNQEILTASDFNPALLNDPARTQNFATKFEIQQPLINVDGFYGRQAAKAKMEAFQLQTERTKEYLELEVSKAYMQLQLAYKAVTVLEKANTTGKANLKLVENYFKQGMLQKTDLLNVQVRVSEIANQLQYAKSNVQNASDYLGFLLNEDTQGKIYKPSEALENTISIEEINTSLSENRKDIQAMTKSSEAYAKMLQSSKMTFLPRLNAFGSYEMYDKNILGTSAKGYLIGAQLSWNVFDGYKSIGKYEKAKAESQKADAEKDQYTKQSQLELNKTNRQLKDAENKVNLSKLAFEQSQEAYRIRQNRFAQGLEKTTDVDAEKYIKIFTFLDKETIDALLAEHTEAPHLRVLQKKLAEELTVMIHGAEEHEKAVFASQAFFKPTVDDLKQLDLKTLTDVFQSLDQAEVTSAEIEAGYPIVDAFVKTGFLSSGNETRRALKENAVSVNKQKVTEEYVIATNDLIANTFVLLQKGKKNYYILKVV